MGIKNEITIDTAGSLDFSALETATEAMQTLKELFGSFPENIKNISESAAACADEFAKWIDPALFDSGAFTTTFLTNIASMMASLEILGNKLNVLQNISIDIKVSAPKIPPIEIPEIIIPEIVIPPIDTSGIEKAAKQSNTLLDYANAGIGVLSILATLFSTYGKKANEPIKNLTKSIIDLQKALDKSAEKTEETKKQILGLDGQPFNKAADEAEKLGDTAEKAGKKGKKSFIDMGSGVTSAFGPFMPLLADIAGYFIDLIKENEGFSQKISEIGEKIKTAFAPVIDFVVSLFDSFISGGEATDEMGANVGGAMDTIMGIVSGASEFITGIIQWISDFWAVNGEAIMAGILSIWEFLQPIIEWIKTFVGGMLEFIMGIFTDDTEAVSKGLAGMWEGIKQIFAPVIEFFRGIFSKAWEAIKGIFSTIGEFFGGIWEDIKERLTTIATNISEGISDAFKATVNAVLGFAEGIINGFIKTINKAIGFINMIPKVNIGLIATVSFPKLAVGGLVEPGQLFLAREAGPELVGSFGSHTAVMNNNQIVESVSHGVYEAQREQNALLRDVRSLLTAMLNSNDKMNVYLDGKQITATVEKYQRERGVQLVSANLGYKY